MNPKGLRITGTFLNEISFDIPSQNWGPDEWRKDFDAMRTIGIDTVIIIKGGLRQETVFPSKVLGTSPLLDLATLFLDEASGHHMQLYFGTYDSWEWARERSWKEEIAINKKFMREVYERFGAHAAFAGWYLAHETSHRQFGFREIYAELSAEAKTLTPNKRVLISPFYPSSKVYPDHALEPEEFADNWRQMLAGITTIDCAAFQDGTAPLAELEAYMQEAKKAMDDCGIEFWSNVETFTREMPIKFPPIDFRELHSKLLIAEKHAAKAITFEFSHFMSPNSCYPSAANLYRRYREYFQI